MRALCFVLMPFGQKADEAGRMVDFDKVFTGVIAPAVEAAGLDVIRADQEIVGGSIHKPMFERLMLCEYAVADLTATNPNVYYELGVRHALRPHTTVLTFSDRTQLPFDLASMRGVRYGLDDKGAVKDPPGAVERLAKQLRDAGEASCDSPLYQLITELEPPIIDHQRTDVFRDRVEYSRRHKQRLQEGRAVGLQALVDIEHELGDLGRIEAGVLVDLFLSYRAVKGFEQMVALFDHLPTPLRRTRLIQEQYAFALNRLGRGDRAEAVLKQVLEEHGPSSETCGLLGRVYKDRWDAARKGGRSALGTAALLKRATEVYLQGFEADWRDAYPGINAVTLMELAEPPDKRRLEILPVVRYAVKRKIATGAPDYWDHATELELAVLADDQEAATDALTSAVGAVREHWEPETTARNLALIREARERRGRPTPWITDIEAELDAAVQAHKPRG